METDGSPSQSQNDDTQGDDGVPVAAEIDMGIHIVRIPVMAMIPNSRMLIPPSTGVGIPVITVFTGAKKEITMAMQAARKTTDTEQTLVRAMIPMFSL